MPEPAASHVPALDAVDAPGAPPVPASFAWPIRVYWEDTDAGGIVFYANYLKFFERARTEWLRACGLGQQQLKDSIGGMFVVTDTQLRYLRPARLDDELLVTARLQEAGRASLIIHQQAFHRSAADTLPAQAPTPICEGSIRIAWVDAVHLQARRIPTVILDRLKSIP